MDEVYLPAEDSYLLLNHVERLVYGTVLDVGTGSGIQAIAAACKPNVSYVLAIDINKKSLEKAKHNALAKGVFEKISFQCSDLFEKIDECFDWILFNPPYLPSEDGLHDQTWDGGKVGNEIIEKFLKQAKAHLKPGGSILLIFSSETNFTPLGYGYRWEMLEEMKLFFETLYCFRLSLL